MFWEYPPLSSMNKCQNIIQLTPMNELISWPKVRLYQIRLQSEKFRTGGGGGGGGGGGAVMNLAGKNN